MLKLAHETVDIFTVKNQTTFGWIEMNRIINLY